MQAEYSSGLYQGSPAGRHVTRTQHIYANAYSPDRDGGEEGHHNRVLLYIADN